MTDIQITQELAALLVGVGLASAAMMGVLFLLASIVGEMLGPLWRVGDRLGSVVARMRLRRIARLRQRRLTRRPRSVAL